MWRRCRVELLEQRALLSIVQPELNSWTPEVDPAWFAELAPLPRLAAQAPLALAAAPSVQGSVRQVAWQGESIAARADQWVVQLTEQGTRLAGSVAGTAGLLATPLFSTQVLAGLGLEGMVLLQIDPAADFATVQTWLATNPYVAYAEPNRVLATEAIPGDTSFPLLWGLHNTGQTGGRADADIDAPEAWEISTGRFSVVVGVIDTGVDYTHPDLAANVWTNPGEIPGNQIDDDRNGFVDDVHGYDFANGDGDPLDDNGHGTHVAGTIAAVGNNGQGVAGVSWAGSVMVLKFLDAQGNGFTSAAVAALNYATMMRRSYGVDVRVTNNSWGGSGTSQALYDAIRASGDAGVLFVAAAGNDGIDTDTQPHYPSGYDLENVIAVAASDHNDQLASFSNRGAASVDLAAPGVNIYSTLPGNAYGSYSGTSMAAPHVSGVAALAWSVAPAASVAQVRSAILGGVDSVASLGGLVATGGRLNARNTLQGLALSVAASDPAAGSAVATPPVDFTLTLTHPYDPSSVDAGDLRVNGKPADRVVLAGANTLTFQFSTSPVAAQGPQVMAVAAGSILRMGDGKPASAWQATFYYDALRLAVVSTTPGQGAVLSAAPAQLVLNFNEPVDFQSVDVGDVLLSEGSAVSVAMVDADSIAYTLSGLPREGEVTYSLLEGAIGDAYGTPGPAFAGRFTIDDPAIAWYASSNVPRPITDYSTITSTLAISDSYAIADLDVELDIAHTYDADLEAYLIAPDGTRITLFSRIGGSGDGFSGTVLDDEAETGIASGEAPFRGRYRPQGLLAAVDDRDVAGTWTLELSDRGARDEGTLVGWALVVERSHEVPPRIAAIDRLPPDGGDLWGTLDQLVVHFSKPMLAAGVNDPASWRLVEAGPDAAFDTADDVNYPLALASPYAGGLTATLQRTGGAALLPGSYCFTARSSRLADLSGTLLDGNGDGLGGDDFVTRFHLLPNDWYPSGDAPKPIADLGTITSTITIGEAIPIADLDVLVHITHSYDADLDVYLIAPGGSRVELFSDVGGSGDNFTGTILDDEAGTSIVDGSAPFNGRYRPEQALSAFDGLNAKGVWTLEISDDSGLDVGTLEGWAMIVQRGLEIAPTITAVDQLPVEWAELFGPVDRFDVHFSEPMNAASVVDPRNWSLVAAGPDGLFDTADDAGYPLTIEPSSAGGLAAVVRPSLGRLPPGRYRLTARSGGLEDLFGSPLDGNSNGIGGDDYLRHFVVLSSNRYASADVPKSIVDFARITSTIAVTDSFRLADVDVQVFVSHPYVSDLDVFLIAPDGTRVELFTDVGASGDNFAGTVLDDEAATPITLGTAPFAGRYRPERSLAVLDGLMAAGTWTLEITDDAQLDGGTLDGWALILTPDALPPPRILGHGPNAITPAPVGAVQFKFDRPMDTTSFAPADDVLSFLGPEGPIVPTGFQWLDSQTLAVRFAFQQAMGTYTLVLGPGILDPTGVALDRDGDLVAGELPDDRYTATFVVAQPLGTVDFRQLVDLDPSSTELWYQVQAARPGTLTLQANFQVGVGTAEIALYDQSGSGPPVAISIPTYGNRRIDRQVAAAGETYYIKVSGTNPDIDLFVANLLVQTGDTVTVFGTEGLDRFEFQATTARQVTVNGLRYEFDPASVSEVAFHGAGGGDQVVLGDSSATQSVSLWPGAALVTGGGYSVRVDGVESITAQRGAVVDLYDSSGTDKLVLKPDAAVFSGSGFANRAEGFAQVRAHSTSGADDTALLYGDGGRPDRFTARPREAMLTSAGYSWRAESFRYVYAYGAKGGGDVAVLYDDPDGNDTLKAWPDQVRLYGSTYHNRACGFDFAYAYATGGTADVALLYDNPSAADTFKAWPDQARLYGSGYHNRAYGFDFAYAYATKGSGDAAVFNDDPVAADTLKAWPNEVRLQGAGYQNRGYGFDTTYAYATKGSGDAAVLYDDPGGKDTFSAWPDRVRFDGPAFHNRANGFDSVYAVGTRQSGDLAILYDDPNGKDTLQAWPDRVKFDGAGFHSRASSFDSVYVYATKGRGDVALLYDQPGGKDTLDAWPTQARLYGAGFKNCAYSFDRVSAYATPGDGDLARLFDSALDDLLQAQDDWARLSNAGLNFANLAVAFDRVEATSSNDGDVKDVSPAVDFLFTFGPW